MAFDQPTRLRLQRFVNDVRRLLEQEFTRQLQNDYGLDPGNGHVAEIDSLRHLDDAGRETARILRDTLAHYQASDHVDAQAGLQRIVREQAFTVLNRLAALRMAEARGLLIDSVAQGPQSRGFQLYQLMAGAGLGETGDAYRCYLFSVFDELAQDLPGLFDRFAPQGRLFPKSTVLSSGDPLHPGVLELVNAPEIDLLWAQDETIGWIYQYFNSKDERKAMRDASQAPRNSRELAVRNQFFTPRYVVEFLVDNTLGRLWFNATGGQTGLRDRCQYLLVKPDEKPEAALRLRDPRTLKLLDPACGSMHFGLYAFDLFAEIYREAWDWEQQQGPGSLDVSTQAQAGFKPLCHTYADRDDYLRDVPRLIIEHNLYGVDIDPRAAQIASLALWLRAQRAWHDDGVKAVDRPLIGRGHVIAATAPPAEPELRQQFAAGLDERDAVLFEKTLQLLKGLPEMGVLLQVERELPKLVREVYVGKGTGLFAAQESEGWQLAEERLRAALVEFAQAAKSTYQGRLFAQDALQGLRLIDLCREIFDVVVMNPPFGAASKLGKAYIDLNFNRARNDLLCVFVDRGAELLASGGYLGCLTSRTVLFLTSFAEWRQSTLLSTAPPCLVADLGQGVLDAAMVETAAYCLKKGEDPSTETPFLRLTNSKNREADLRALSSRFSAGTSVENAFEIAPNSFRKIPGAPFSYWVSEEVRDLFGNFERFEGDGVVVRVTNPTADNFRYLRNYWECNSSRIGENNGYVPYAKGGSSRRYYYDVNLLAMWDPRVPTYKGYQGTIHRSDIRPASLDYFFKPGIMWPLRAPRLCAQAFPEGTAFSARSQCLFAPPSSLAYFLGLMNSSVLDYLFKAALGRTDFPEFIVGVLRNLPKPNPPDPMKREISNLALQAAKQSRRSAAFEELDHMFVGPRMAFNRSLGSLVDSANLSLAQQKSVLGDIEKCQAAIDELVLVAYGFSLQAKLEIAESTRLHRDNSEVSEVENVFEIADENSEDELEAAGSDDILTLAKKLTSWLVGCAYGRWNATITDVDLEVGLALNIFERQPISPFANNINAISNDGFGGQYSILVDDPGHGFDIISLVECRLENIWGAKWVAIQAELCQLMQSESIRQFFRKGNGFFEFHIQQYSKSGRKSPIYWPLATASGSYTLWLYYPSLTRQTLYTAINDFVEPKLSHVAGDVAALRNKGAARSRDEEKRFEAVEALELELLELRDQLLKIAPGWHPNHDDGVQITAAPLWPLFRHKPWQKILKETWAKLEKGDYDWAHLAMNYWPDRVRAKCQTDKSLAIAHGLEPLYIEPPPKAAAKRGRKAREA